MSTPTSTISDPRLVFSIHGERDLAFEPNCMVFDHTRDLWFVTCTLCAVYVCSADDGSLVTKTYTLQPGRRVLIHPHRIAIDHEHGRLLLTTDFEVPLQVRSLRDQSFLSSIGKRGSGDLEFHFPQGIAVDEHHHRVVVSDTNNHRLQVLSSVDLSFLFSVGGNVGSQPGEFCGPSSIAIDHDRHRIIVADTNNHRVQVLSSIDGSFLFEFGSRGDQAGQFNRPLGVCLANQGRIIVADYYNHRLQAFTHEGHHISSFDCGEHVRTISVAFDKHRGHIAFTARNRVHVIGANQWLADTFTWRVDRHRYAPSWIKQAVSTMTMIRSLVDESVLSMIPNELLFEIFSMLVEAPRYHPPDSPSSTTPAVPSQQNRKCYVM